MIEILVAKIIEGIEGIPAIWSCWLLLTKGIEQRILPASAPGHILESALVAYFDAQFDYLWELAGEKKYELDIFMHLPARDTSHALLETMLDEINALRTNATLPTRTKAELESAMLTKLIG